MDQVEANSTRRKGLWATLAIATVTSASAVTIALPATSKADPEPAPPPPSTTAASPAPAPAPAGPASPPPQPGDPNATPPPPPVDPNAPPPPAVDPNAGRIGNAVGGFSFILPAGWVESDASHLDYGSELLSKTTGPAAPGQPPPVANDTRIVMGRLDQKLYASAEANNAKAAVRLGSDMGEFFLPYPGTRINQETTPLTGANEITGSASYYEVKFSDPSKPNGQIWTGVIGSPTAGTAAGPPQRWFVVWLGTGNDPVDRGAAKALAESIQPWTAPAAPPAPTGPPPGAPVPPPPAAPAPPPPAAPAPPPPPAAPAPPPPAAPAPPAPAPGQAPAGEVSPTPAPTPPRTTST